MTWISFVDLLRYVCGSCLCTRSNSSRSVSNRADLTKPHVSLAQILPNEILAHMFIQCSESGLPVVYLPPKRDLYYPWSLGHICSRWRAALWNTSDIWSTTYVTTSGQDQLVLEMLSHILLQTVGTISLSINEYSNYDSVLKDIIVSFSHRFKYLALSPSTRRPLNAFFNLDPGSLNYIEALYLFSVYPARGLRSENNPYLRFPSLKQLGISGDTSITPYLPQFPLSQLTHLSVSGDMISPTIVHFLLQQCTPLIFAEFAICEEMWDVSRYRTTGTITSSLERIDISLSFNLDWETFLGPLFLSSLTNFASLYISSPVGATPTFMHAMSALVNRSGCPLDFFSISPHLEPFPSMNCPEIIGLIQTMPHLTTFVSGYILESALISTVFKILPQLEMIDWKVGPDGLHIVLNILDDFVSQSLWSPRLFPSSITITCCNGNGFISARTRYLSRYDAYVEAGIDIIVQNAEYYDMRFLDRVYVD